MEAELYRTMCAKYQRTPPFFGLWVRMGLERMVSLSRCTESLHRLLGYDFDEAHVQAAQRWLVEWRAIIVDSSFRLPDRRPLTLQDALRHPALGKVVAGEPYSGVGHPNGTRARLDDLVWSYSRWMKKAPGTAHDPPSVRVALLKKHPRGWIDHPLLSQ